MCVCKQHKTDSAGCIICVYKYVCMHKQFICNSIVLHIYVCIHLYIIVIKCYQFQRQFGTCKELDKVEGGEIV